MFLFILLFLLFQVSVVLVKRSQRRNLRRRYRRVQVTRTAAAPTVTCRTVEKLFNRIYAFSRKMTVSKSYVHYTVRQHRYEIEVLRRALKHRPPRPVPVNHAWAMDMTGKQDAFGNIHSMVGIVDHGSRKLLALEVLKVRNAWTLLGHLFLSIGKYGKPKAIRTDNDAVFRSRVFRIVMRLAAIRHQFTAPGCPWMNGRIERLFGTLKGKLDQIRINGGEALVHLLPEFWF